MSYLIKKYSNRKLYDTERRAYTTLAEIAGIVRSGTEGVLVRDEANGRDITASVMAQIILEEKKDAKAKTSVVSIDALKKFIREGETSVRELADKYAPRVRSSIHNLVEEGRKVTDKGRRLLKEEVSDIFGEIEKVRKRVVEQHLDGALKALHRSGPTRQEVRALIEKIDGLSRRLDDLHGVRTRPLVRKKKTTVKPRVTKRALMMPNPEGGN